VPPSHAKIGFGFLEFIVDHYNPNPPSYVFALIFIFIEGEGGCKGGFRNPNPPTTFIKMGSINVTHICPLMGVPTTGHSSLDFSDFGS